MGRWIVIACLLAAGGEGLDKLKAILSGDAVAGC